MADMMTTAVHGHADEGWGAVADAFASNFDSYGEVGAACAVYADGELVVDLWGGLADPRTGRRWEQDAITTVYSTTKGATAVCAHMLVERGQLDLDTPVAAYWPEFGQEGKEEIRVRWLLSHQAGLPGIDTPLTLEEACAWAPVIRALEQQKPLWEPGAWESYHALTFGFLVGEVVRRITGMTIGQFFASEVARPLGLSAWIGLPDSEETRVAYLVADSSTADLLDARIDAMFEKLIRETNVTVPPQAKAALTQMWSRPDIGIRLGGAFPQTPDGAHNMRIVRASEHPGSGMVSDARSLARMYAAMIGDIDGIRLVQSRTVGGMCVVQPAPPYGVPAELEEFMLEAFPPSRSLGFVRPTRLQPLLGPRCFGHPGKGGSLAFADPDRQIGFGYVMNRIAQNNRTVDNLVAAVADCTG